MSSGAKVVSALVKQTDRKQIPQSGWKILPLVSNGLTVSAELTNSETLADSRIAKAGMVTGLGVEGDIEVELMFETYDDLIAAAFWNEWKNGGSNKKTLDIGSTKTQFAISKDFTDINVNHVFTGCVLSKFSLSVDASSLVKATFGFKGLGYQESNSTSFAKSPAKTPDSAKASSLSIGDIKVDGSKLNVCVESFSFELDNQTEVQKCLGSEIYGGNILAMVANASGSMTIAYSPEAHDIIKKQLTGSTIAIEFPIMFGTNKYIIKVPKAQISGEIPSPSGSDLVTVDVSYTVVDESPIIEKHTA